MLWVEVVVLFCAFWIYHQSISLDELCFSYDGKARKKWPLSQCQTPFIFSSITHPIQITTGILTPPKEYASLPILHWKLILPNPWKKQQQILAFLHVSILCARNFRNRDGVGVLKNATLLPPAFSTGPSLRNLAGPMLGLQVCSGFEKHGRARFTASQSTKRTRFQQIYPFACKEYCISAA